ncbi:MAG TPA: serine/threonine-protein kinase [Planctomicrobium sp.]|nr:serine/threonine-protein kinase [Planctomicrobium sp.]
MTDPNDNVSPSDDWVERMVELDRAVRSTLRSTPADDGSDLTEAQKLMANLQLMHSPLLKGVFRSPATGIPVRIGRYEIQRMLGAGGFAVVYQSRDQRLNRDVAVKIPLPPGLLNPDARQRFVQEAQLAAQLDHPHIVPAYEAGEDGPVPFIAYAYCSGPTLAQWLKENGPVSAASAATLMVSLADAVAYSHDQGILHRDLKPANVLLFPTRHATDQQFPFIPKLADFGLAKLMESAAADTGSSVILGTPLYMAPEQIEATHSSSGTATDVYGLGGILYELLTGQPPFCGETVVQVLESIRAGKMTRVRKINSRVPYELAVICEKALAIRPQDRYSSAAALRDDLHRFLKGEFIQGRPVGIVVQAVRSLRAAPRVNEASGYVILSHLAMLCWICAWPLGILVGLPMTHGTTLEELVPYTAPLAVMHVFSIALGWLIGRRNIWAAAISAALGGLLSLFVFSVLVRWINPPYPSIYPNERTRDIVFLLLFSIFLMQILLCSCAWLSLRRGK